MTLVDDETGKAVHPASTITMPIVEFDKIVRRLDQAQADLAAARLDAERYKGALDTAAWMLERWEGAFASSAPTLSHETINFLLSLSAYAARVQERSDGKE